MGNDRTRSARPGKRGRIGGRKATAHSLLDVPCKARARFSFIRCSVAESVRAFSAQVERIGSEGVDEELFPRIRELVSLFLKAACLYL